MEIIAQYQIVISAFIAFSVIWFVDNKLLQRFRKEEKFFFPSYLPGPSWYHYLPGRAALQLYLKPSCFRISMIELARQFGTVFQVHFNFRRYVSTADPEDINQILSTREDFTRSRGAVRVLDAAIPGSIFALPPKEHATTRKALFSKFTPKLLESYQPFIATGTEEMCQMLSAFASNENAQSLDISSVISVATLRVIMECTFNVSMPVRSRVAFWDAVHASIHEMQQEAMYYRVRRFFNRSSNMELLKNAVEKSRSPTRIFIRQRMGCTEVTEDERNEEMKGIKTFKSSMSDEEKDLLDLIIRHVNGDLDLATSHSLAFSISSTFTSSQTIAWAVYELCKRPDVVKMMQDEVDQVVKREGLGDNDSLSFKAAKNLPLATAVFKECLRLHPVTSVLVRQAARDTTLKGSGLQISKGTRVLLQLEHMQTSKEVWKSGSDFNPLQWLSNGLNVPRGSYLPFSSGQNRCPGQFFAEYEGIYMIAEMCRRFNFSLACKPDDVRTVSGWMDAPKFSSKNNGVYDQGIPVFVSLR